MMQFDLQVLPTHWLGKPYGMPELELGIGIGWFQRIVEGIQLELPYRSDRQETVISLLISLLRNVLS